ncbi:MAG: hypothetical protein Q8M76_16695 [Spirochaetaceae bacterium]|nr:hypothetical protein [Spirochaetaceae bacterium]
MMDCTAAARLLDAWEAGAETAETELAALRSHLRTCAICRRRFGLLLPLLERDAAARATQAATPRASPRAESLADRVMASIPRSFRARFVAARYAARYAAIAACALILVGLGLALHLGMREPGEITVRFVLDAPDAHAVALAGDFTAWKTEGWDLSRATSLSPWTITVKLRKDALYVYNFVIDGERWIPDPATPESASDGFGGTSSLLRL